MGNAPPSVWEHMKYGTGQYHSQYGVPRSEITKERLSIANSGSVWWNNGNIEIQVKEKPEGDWTKGRLPYLETALENMRTAQLGKVWWTNGIKDAH